MSDIDIILQFSVIGLCLAATFCRIKPGSGGK